MSHIYYEFICTIHSPLLSDPCRSNSFCIFNECIALVTWLRLRFISLHNFKIVLWGCLLKYCKTAFSTSFKPSFSVSFSVSLDSKNAGWIKMVDVKESLSSSISKKGLGEPLASKAFNIFLKPVLRPNTLSRLRQRVVLYTFPWL